MVICEALQVTPEELLIGKPVDEVPAHDQTISSDGQAYSHLEIECTGHLGLTSVEYKEQVESKKQEILNFCKTI